MARMLSFKRSYTASAVILGALILLSVIGGIRSGFYGVGHAVGALSVALVALFPIYWRGGILANPRLAIIISVAFAFATGGMVALGFIDFVQTGGGEGPKSEGSPLAKMIALVFGAAIGVCPWLLTSLRGLPHWNTQPTANQAVSGNRR